jgi:hypothetical protein
LLDAAQKKPRESAREAGIEPGSRNFIQAKLPLVVAVTLIALGLVIAGLTRLASLLHALLVLLRRLLARTGLFLMARRRA